MGDHYESKPKNIRLGWKCLTVTNSGFYVRKKLYVTGPSKRTKQSKKCNMKNKLMTKKQKQKQKQKQKKNNKFELLASLSFLLTWGLLHTTFYACKLFPYRRKLDRFTLSPSLILAGYSNREVPQGALLR